MRLSGDHTSLRTAVLPDNVIQRLADNYSDFFANIGAMDGHEIVRDLNEHVHEQMPGKEDLITEWILNSASQNEGDLEEDIPAFINSAKFFFEHNKEARFKQAVEAVNKESLRSMNPRNILDFPLNKLAWVEREYKKLTTDPKVNELTTAMPPGSALFYNGHGYQFYKITDVRAACSLSQGTSWCTKREQDSSNYLKEGPLYLIYRKAFSYGLLHVVASNMMKVQLKDHDNNEIKVIDENLRQALIDSGLMDQILSGNSRMYIRDFKCFVGTKLNDYLADLCTRSAELAYYYALYVLGARFPKGEPVIAQDPQHAILYAQDVIKGRFKEAEATIDGTLHWGEYMRMLEKVNPEDWEDLVFEDKQGVRRSSFELSSNWSLIKN